MVSATGSAGKSTVRDLNADDAGDPEIHRKTVVSRAEEFRRCYRPALKRDAKLQGGITLTWDIDGAGDVVRESVVESSTTIHDSLMIECMLEKVHAWKFDTGPKDTITTLTYPFYFNPSL